MKTNQIAVIAVFLIAFVVSVSAYIQHFITTIQGEQWAVLIVGAILPPLGVLHGVLVWFGVF